MFLARLRDGESVRVGEVTFIVTATHAGQSRIVIDAPAAMEIDRFDAEGTCLTPASVLAKRVKVPSREAFYTQQQNRADFILAADELGGRGNA